MRAAAVAAELEREGLEVSSVAASPSHHDVAAGGLASPPTWLRRANGGLEMAELLFAPDPEPPDVAVEIPDAVAWGEASETAAARATRPRRAPVPPTETRRRRRARDRAATASAQPLPR